MTSAATGAPLPPCDKESLSLENRTLTYSWNCMMRRGQEAKIAGLEMKDGGDDPLDDGLTLLSLSVWVV